MLLPGAARERVAASEASPRLISHASRIPASPLPPSRRAWRVRKMCGEDNLKEGLQTRRPREENGKADIEEPRGRVGCAAVLETAGFEVDLKEGTRKAVKCRRSDVIVIHDGKGWFDPLSDAKGAVYSLVQNLDGCDFLEAFMQGASLVGFEPRRP